jgi:hypothetical protein
LAHEWRAEFFKEIQGRFERGEGVEDFDTTMRRVLDILLEGYGVGEDVWDEETRQKLVQAWHTQTPWPDVLPALSRLRDKYFM